MRAAATWRCTTRWSRCWRLDTHAKSFLETPAVLLAATRWRRRAGRASALARTEIASRIGAGGMGEVYRAHDAQLGRDVAIKMLPPIFARDPDRLARFDREARMLAALNHPHIGAIYGVEQSEGAPALILELVDGPTLADRLAHGPIPLTEVARHRSADCRCAGGRARQRDRSPGPEAGQHQDHARWHREGARLRPGQGGRARRTSMIRRSHSPGTASDTHDGAILGTSAYMSPEQARGQTVDKRTDIWAFGCVVYEMLTARAVVVGRDGLRSHRSDSRRRPGLGRAAGDDAAEHSSSAAPLPREGIGTSTAGHRRRASGTRRCGR